MRKHCSLILSIILVIIATSVYYLSVRSTASPIHRPVIRLLSLHLILQAVSVERRANLGHCFKHRRLLG